MNDRHTILLSISQALKITTKRKESHKDALTGDIGNLINQVLPPYGKNFEENLALFRKNADELKADFHTVSSVEEIIRNIIKIKVAENWRSVATHPDELTESICSRLDLPIIKTQTGYDIHQLEKCDASITTCDCLVAQTGSVVVTSKSTQGRAISVLPPHHVVIAKKEQLVPSLPDAIQLIKNKYHGAFPSMISFITGPSRTGDIERILVLGAHGPKKLTIFLII